MERKKYQQRREYPTLHVRLHEEDREWLKAYAARHYLSMTEVIGRMLLEFRKQNEQKESQS